MIDYETGRAEMRCKGGAGCHVPTASNRSRNNPAVAAAALLTALVLQSADLRADLRFRSAEQVDGQRQWSTPRRYADPANTVYPRMLADGTQVASEEVQVFFQGYITQDDVYAAKVMENLVRRGKHRIADNSVAFAGNGGDVDAAMDLGRVLRKLGVSTLVAHGDQCLSSCVFAFMGGDRRTVAGRLGIHRPYFASTRKVAERRSYYRQLQKRLQQYIEELDFPPSLYEAVMAVPPESINMLTAVDLKKFYLHGMSPSTEDEVDADAAGALGISFPEYLRQKAQLQPCAGGGRACDGEAQEAAESGAAIPGTMQGAVRAP